MSLTLTFADRTLPIDSDTQRLVAADWCRDHARGDLADRLADHWRFRTAGSPSDALPLYAVEYRTAGRWSAQDDDTVYAARDVEWYDRLDAATARARQVAAGIRADEDLILWDRTAEAGADEGDMSSLSLATIVARVTAYPPAHSAEPLHATGIDLLPAGTHCRRY